MGEEFLDRLFAGGRRSPIRPGLSGGSLASIRRSGLPHLPLQGCLIQFWRFGRTILVRTPLQDARCIDELRTQA
jgi:hypothetical protein